MVPARPRERLCLARSCQGRSLAGNSAAGFEPLDRGVSETWVSHDTYGMDTLLCWSGTPGGKWGGHDGTGVHLTDDERVTLCGKTVIDVPRFPRTIEPLSCEEC